MHGSVDQPIIRIFPSPTEAALSVTEDARSQLGVRREEARTGVFFQFAVDFL